MDGNMQLPFLHVGMVVLLSFATSTCIYLAAEHIRPPSAYPAR